MSQIMVLISLFLIPAYIFRFSVFGVPTNIFEVVVAALTIVFIIERFISPSSMATRFRVGFWPAYVLLAAAIFAAVIAPDRTAALGILKGWFFVPAVLYFIIINIFEKKNLRLLTIPLFVSLLLVSVWAGLQKLGIISTLFYQVGDSGFNDYLVRIRAFGPFESPNYLAMFTVPLIFVSLPILGFFKRSTDQLMIMVLYLLPLFALYASHSLGGLLAFGFGLVSLLAFGLAKLYRARLVNSGRKIIFLAIALVIVAVGFAYIFSSISSETYSNAVRRDIYNYSFSLIKDHPIAGIGLGQFQKAVDESSKGDLGFQLYGLSYALHPHNVFLAFWLNLGILGIFSFIYLIGSFFWRLGRRGGDILLLSSTFAAMVAILIHGLVDTTYFKNDLSAIFWLLLAISVILGVKNGATGNQSDS